MQWHEAATSRQTTGRTANFIKILLQSQREDKNEVEVKDTLFAGQGLYARDPKRTGRNNPRHSQMSKMRCLNCELEGCTIGRFTSPRDEPRIAKNLESWRK